MRRSKKTLLAHALDLTGFGCLLRAARSWQGVLLLNYHRIGDARFSLLDRNLWSATADDFDLQMRFISRNFDVVPLGELDWALRQSRGRFVLITFDDGYRDNYQEAYPILRTYSCPATFFLTSGFLDEKRLPWWDEIAWMVRTARAAAIRENPWTGPSMLLDVPSREASIQKLLSIYKRLPDHRTDDYLNFLADVLATGRYSLEGGVDLWMTWDMVREMKSQGMTFGGHTVTHPVLANQSAEQQDFEIGQSGRRIAEELGEPTTAFSYPVGGHNSFNADSRAALERHGYQWGFTYFGGYVRPGSSIDRYAMPRTAVELDISGASFRALATLPQLFA